MLRTAQDITGASIRARDGDAGKVYDLYFDDNRWTVRYVVADTGGLLSSNLVLLSPIAIEPMGDGDGNVRTWLSKEEMERSPDIDAAKPVSRQEEEEYLRHYGWPAYWTGPYAWGAWYNPAAVAAATAAGEAAKEMPEEPEGDPHLRSMNEVRNYTLSAVDGELGHIDDFLVDDETWEVRYLVVDTSNWWFGRKVLLLPERVEDVEWNQRLVRVSVEKEAVKAAPEWDGNAELSRGYEERLRGYYEAEPYWQVR